MIKTLTQRILVGFFFVIGINSQLNSQISSNSIYFNGNKLISISDNSVFDVSTNSQITFEGWMKYCDEGILFSKNWCNYEAGYYLKVNASGKLEFLAHENSVCNAGNLIHTISNASFLSDTWNHFAVVIINENNNINVKLYMNGVLDISQNVAGVFNNSSEPLILGAYKGINGNYALGYKGYLDEFRIYNTELQANELKLVIPIPINLFVHYKMEPNLINNNVLLNTGNSGSTNLGNGFDFNLNNTNIEILSNNLNCNKDTIQNSGNNNNTNTTSNFTIVFPNVITINEDHTNELFVPKIYNIKELKVEILNRWGQVITEYNGMEFAWDGKYKGEKVSEGVYYYKYEALNTMNEKVSGQGFVTVIY